MPTYAHITRRHAHTRIHSCPFFFFASHLSSSSVAHFIDRVKEAFSGKKEVEQGGSLIINNEEKKGGVKR